MDVGSNGVVNMLEKDKVITEHLRGESKSEIARKTGLSRPTVRKYIAEYEQMGQRIKEASTLEEKEAIIIESSKKPTYDSINRKRYKITPEIEEIINECLDNNELKTKSGNRKLIMKRIDIHEHLLKLGFDVSYRSVCSYVETRVEKKKEAYIRQSYPPGISAEFDWGEVTLAIDELGGEHRMKIGVFTLKNSDYRFARLYTHENTECFLDVHRQFFEHIEGIPKEVVYDNAIVQVKRFSGGEKKPTDAVVRLSAYYGYEPRYTNYYRGNEKGHVERSVEVVRRKAYCTKQCFATIADAETALIEAVNKNNASIKQRTGISADTAFAYESEFLVPDRIPMDVSIFMKVSVNKYSLIYVDTHFYSVPDFLSEKRVMVRKYPDRIIVYYNDEFIFKTKRVLKGRNQYQIDINHYLETLKKKPGAITHSLALKQAKPWLQKVFHDYYGKKPRDFITLLKLIQKNSLHDVQVAIKKLEMKRLPVTNAYIYNELTTENVDASTPHAGYDAIQKACEEQLFIISSLYGLGGASNERIH